MIEIYEIKQLEEKLDCEINVFITTEYISLKVGNKCRLLSHMLHRCNLDVHCNKNGLFQIYFNEFNISEILNAFTEVNNNFDKLLLGFCKKYADNEFMMTSTFKEVEA